MMVGMRSGDGRPHPAAWRRTGTAVFIVAGVLLLSMGGAIIAAPATIPLMFVAVRRHPTRVFRIAGTLIAVLTAAELAWALALALVKRLPQSEKAMRAGGWQETVITESLAGKTLGVLGLGRLGKYVARYGQAFGMDVVAWSPNLTDERAAEVSVRRVSKEALFAESDVISLHLVSNTATKGIVGAREIAAMKRTAYIVNTSRAPLIDEQALIGALQERRIAGAGLDVFWTEPLPKDHIVRRLDNVVLTPHLGYVVDENLKRFYENALKNIKSWIAGEPLTPMAK